MSRNKRSDSRLPNAGAYLLPEEAYYYLQCVRVMTQQFLHRSGR